MLAERRQKQRWSLNPRGKFWSEDSNKFGQKLLEKMGWSSGKGLGANEDGMTEHISQNFKNDTKGLGFKERDDLWTEHYDNFSQLLSDLGQDSVKMEKPKSSLVHKSQNSRARVHYHKFTRGKDLSGRSEKEIAQIFGQKALVPDSKKKSPSPPPPQQQQQQQQQEQRDFGVKTVDGGSIADYFKSKMSKLAAVNRTPRERSPDESPAFGLGYEQRDDGNKEPKKKKRAAEEDAAAEKPKKKKKSVQDDDGSAYDNPAFDPNLPEARPNTTTVNDEYDEQVKPKKKKKKSKHENQERVPAEEEKSAYDNPAFDPNLPDARPNTTTVNHDEQVKPKKKKKKSSVPAEEEEEEESAYDNPAFDPNLPESRPEKEDKRTKEKKSKETDVREETEKELKKNKKRKHKKKQTAECYDNPGFDDPRPVPADDFAEQKDKRSKKKNKNEKDGETADKESKKRKRSKNDHAADVEVVERVTKKKKVKFYLELEPENDDRSKSKNTKKQKNKSGIENPGCDADSTEQRVQETISSITTAIDNYQNELENDINEKKLVAHTQTRTPPTPTPTQIDSKNQLIMHLKKNRIQLDFPGSNVHEIKGYGNR